MNAKTEARVKAHGEKLLRIFPNATPHDPVKLCRRLRRLEGQVGRDNERECSVDTGRTETEGIVVAATFLVRLRTILGATDVPVFLNSDPRGCALKIRSEYVAEHNLVIDRDWGGYGLIAPDLTA